jgi:hypothetical protein
MCVRLILLICSIFDLIESIYLIIKMLKVFFFFLCVIVVNIYLRIFKNIVLCKLREITFFWTAAYNYYSEQKCFFFFNFLKESKQTITNIAKHVIWYSSSLFFFFNHKVPFSFANICFVYFSEFQGKCSLYVYQKCLLKPNKKSITLFYLLSLYE